LRTKIKHLKKDRKAEITTQQIVLLVILLTSFAVLLFFLFKLNIQKLSEKEICQSSVQLSKKATFFEKIDCKTNYLCISGGGECKGFTSRETIKINLNDEKIVKNEIRRVLADEMVDCWWMFGEGKVDYVGSSFIGDTACAVCAEIAFDEKLGSYDKLKSISYNDFYEFLKTTYTNKDKTQTYFSYLKLEPLDKMVALYGGKSISFDRKYGIYTGRDKEGYFGRAYYWIVRSPNEILNRALPPVILERTESSQLKCSSFITIP